MKKGRRKGRRKKREGGKWERVGVGKSLKWCHKP